MQRQRREKQGNGFTFIELMVSMVIASFVFAGIYGVYTIQQRSYTVQEQVSEMQQKGRAALDYMVRDIRMAGYNDPNGGCTSRNITSWNNWVAQPATLTFDTCNPVTNNQETIRYDLLGNTLRRTVDSGTAQTIAEDVEAIEFYYALESNTTPGTMQSPSVTSVTGVNNIQRIRSVQISLLIRSTFPDRKYRDEILYQPGSVLDPNNIPAPPAWDINEGATDTNGTGNPPTIDPDGCDDELDRCHYHRRLLITTVKMRNMGLD
ncbi:MAG: PilW family protein [Candidatus Electrothrix sp. GW3-4]|uniref:PilW family protein n=1 Tax=Candidatus Electrothrix sp. GW3-4 TaxID=3126740 RepID=UPI0030CB9D66